MKIIIYEDNHKFRKCFCQCIEDIKKENHLEDIDIVLATDREQDVLNYLSDLTEKALFFIDHYDANNAEKGVALAAKIFESPLNHVVVFVSDYYSEIEYDIDMKTKAMCSVSKSSPHFHNEITKVLLDFTNIFKNEHLILSNDTSSAFYSISMNEIYAVETVKDTNMVVFHSENGEIQTYATITELMKLLNGHFYKISRSCIVNLSKVVVFDKSSGLIVMKDKSEYIVPYRKRKEFLNDYSIYARRTV